jgi:hypothetical protein
MSKYISGVFSSTYSSGGTPQVSPTIPTNNFVYGNQFIQGVIQLTADTKTSLQSTYGANGVYIGMDTANAYSGIKLLGSTSAANGAYIDFTTSGVNYKGRILYDNNVNSMQFYTNAAGSPVVSINAAGVMTMYAGISTDGSHSFTLPTSAGSINNVLTNNGSGGTIWASTVTSVAATVPAFLSITGSPITTSGTLAISLSGTALPVSSGGIGVTTLVANSILLGNGTGGILSPATLTYANGTLTLPSITMVTVSSSGTPSIVGPYLSINGSTFTDNATAASGTAASAVFSSFAQPTLAATNTGITTTVASTIYIAGGPLAGTNETITASYGLWNVGPTRLDSALTVNGGGATVPLVINSSNTSTNAGVLTMLAPALNVGRECEIQLGVLSSMYNGAIIQFNYVSAGSNTNYLGLGLYATNNLFQLYGSGIVKLSANIASTSSTTGILVLVGGIGINNTTDATSATNGGTFTSSGGGAFAKSLWVGTTLTATSLAGTITTATQPNITSLGTLNSALNMSIPGTASITLFTLFVPNLINAGIVQTFLGVSSSNFNTGVIQFNYVSSGATGTAGNFIGIGLWSSNNIFNIYSTGVKVNSTTDATNSNTGGAFTSSGGGAFAKSLWIGGPLNINLANVSIGPLTMVCPSLANNGAIPMYIGVGQANYNTGQIQFNYVSSGSSGFSGNNVGIGMWNANNILQVYSSGAQVTGQLNVSNPGTGSSVMVLDMITPNLGTGTYVEMHIGVQENNYNTGIIQFNYVGAGASTYPNGNFVGIGMWNSINTLSVFSNAARINGSFFINNPTSSGVATLGAFLAPSLATGTDAEIQIGVAGSGMNCAVLQFNYVGNGSSGGGGNNLGLGFFGNNNILRVYSTGITINGSISKSSGSFDIPHPNKAKEKQGYRLRHSFVESNSRGDNLYRYTITTNRCKAEISLPDYFKHLNENPQVFVAPVNVLGIGRGWVCAALEKVYIETSFDGTYNVLVIGTRKDKVAVENFDPLGIEYIQT